MSLISEALKKAQRERHVTPTESPAPRPDSGPTRRRAQSFSPPSLILLGAGIVALFIVSVVSAVLWINRPSPPVNLSAKPTPSRALPNPPPITPPAIPINSTPTAAPIAASAPLAPSSTSIQPAPTGTPIKLSLSPTPAASSTPVATPNPFTPTILSSPQTSPVTASFDPKIQTIIDAWRIAGIRSSGDNSKVFLNDRVYKINELVDVARGIRLTHVTPKNLTFTTPDGITYVRKF